MNIKDLAQDFFDCYGYYPNQSELESFLEESGHFDGSGMPNNVTHINSTGGSRSFLDHLSEEEHSADFFSEFKRLLSEISKDAKQQRQHSRPSEQSLELLFMLLVFLNKVSLFFLLRYCDENGIYVDL